ncbi:Dual specificity protein phosphatase 4 [Nymphon striatum]|nr:Dual specificity protein phosphatase 4 [Nymphon striatum]
MLDCRSFLAFSDGHINGAVNVHCPSILRRRSRGQILPLRTLIPEDEVRERLCGNVPRECYRKVVLYDEKSFDMDSATDDSMLKLVNKCIHIETKMFRANQLTITCFKSMIDTFD